MGCLLHYRVAIVIGTVYIFGHFERVRGQSALFIVTYRMHMDVYEYCSTM